MLQYVFGIRIVQGTKVKWEGNGKLGLIVVIIELITLSLKFASRF